MAKDEEKQDEKPAADPAEKPAWKGSLSADVPQIAPDGHVNLSQEDIDARQ